MSNQKVALITGGGYGLGAAIARKFGEIGYRIAIVGRSQEALEAHAAVLQKDRITCVWHICDAQDWRSVLSAVEFTESALGPPALLVNNAGGWIGDTIETVKPERLLDLIGASVLGTMFFSKAVVPAMKRQGGGFILNIASTSGLFSSRDSAAASTPKAAVRLFTHTFAREVAKYRIKVAVLHPARINKKLAAPEAEAANADGLYKAVSPRQVADIAAFIVEQAPNLVIRELVVTPSDVDL